MTRSRNDGTARRLTNKDSPPINITKGLSSFSRACESGACRLRRRPSSERLSSPLAVRSSTSGSCHRLRPQPQSRRSRAGPGLGGDPCDSGMREARSATRSDPSSPASRSSALGLILATLGCGQRLGVKAAAASGRPLGCCAMAAPKSFSGGPALPAVPGMGCARRGQRLGAAHPARTRAPLPLAAGLAPGRRRGERRRARDASGRREPSSRPPSALARRRTRPDIDSDRAPRRAMQSRRPDGLMRAARY